MIYQAWKLNPRFALFCQGCLLSLENHRHKSKNSSWEMSFRFFFFQKNQSGCSRLKTFESKVPQVKPAYCVKNEFRHCWRILSWQTERGRAHLPVREVHGLVRGGVQLFPLLLRLTHDHTGPSRLSQTTFWERHSSGAFCRYRRRISWSKCLGGSKYHHHVRYTTGTITNKLFLQYT